MNKTLEEIGINTEELEKSKKSHKIPFYFLIERYREAKEKKIQKKEYSRRQNTLRSIEKLLLRSGSIDNISVIDMKDDELFSIINS